MVLRITAADRARLALPPDWKCNDLITFVDRVDFDRLGPERAAALNAIDTRLVLPPDQIELVVEGGAEALRKSAPFQAFLRGF